MKVNEGENEKRIKDIGKESEKTGLIRFNNVLMYWLGIDNRQWRSNSVNEFRVKDCSVTHTRTSLKR